MSNHHIIEQLIARYYIENDPDNTLTIAVNEGVFSYNVVRRNGDNNPEGWTLSFEKGWDLAFKQHQVEVTRGEDEWLELFRPEAEEPSMAATWHHLFWEAVFVLSIATGIGMLVSMLP